MSHKQKQRPTIKIKRIPEKIRSVVLLELADKEMPSTTEVYVGDLLSVIHQHEELMEYLPTMSGIDPAKEDHEEYEDE